MSVCVNSFGPYSREPYEQKRVEQVAGVVPAWGARAPYVDCCVWLCCGHILVALAFHSPAERLRLGALTALPMPVP